MLKLLEHIVFTVIGIAITVENFVIVLAAIRNKSLRENTHYNLVLSLSVCDFVFGLNVIIYGTVIVHVNNDSSDKDFYILCAIHYCVISWNYMTSLVQTFFICFNRYLVVTENKLDHLLWKGKRKYILFLVTSIIILILNSSILSSVVQGCDINSVMGNTMYAIFFSSVQALTAILTFLFYFVTLWKIYKLHRKTDCNLENMDDNRRREIRMKKRMVKSMKTVSLILTTFLISTIPAVVLGLKSVSSHLDIILLLGFSNLNCAVNPIIYCSQIEVLRKEIAAMFRI